MPTLISNLPRSYGVLLSRLVWPTALLLILTLGFVLVTVVWTSESADATASERKRLQLTAAIEQTLDVLENRLAQLVSTPALLEPQRTLPGVVASRFAHRATQYFDFTGAFLLGAGDQVLAGMTLEANEKADVGQIRLLATDLIAAARVNATTAPSGTAPDRSSVQRSRDLAVSRLLYNGSAVFAVAALPFELRGDSSGMADRSEPAIAVGYRRLDDLDLKKIAEFHAMDGFQVLTRPPEEGWSALPVRDARGEATAFLVWRPDQPGEVMRERLVPLTLFGSCVALALFVFVVAYIRWIARDLARSQERTQHILGRDPLSGLPNRLLFAERLDEELSRIQRQDPGLAVMFLDLDRFKDVNDTYGHQAGDELIKLVANRLSTLLRGSDTLARFGGDEFAVIQTNVRTAEEASSLARRILDAIDIPFEIAGAQVTVGVSIGIALAPENGTNHEILMRLADTALYQAKSEGRNRFSFFARRMDETIRMRKVVEEELREAITQDELALHYQPIYSADGQTIVGLEALVRWPHHTQGLISPARFISIAEERGLVIPLGEWVLRRACTDGKRWPGLTIAVNVSPIQFRHRDFVASVVRALDETGFEASRLELELTEGVVVEDADAAEAAMMDLRALGVNLALDDFGTGYSSLIYLRRFAFDKIKIDRSFLESMEATGESAILVHSIVHLGRALGLTVTAEGVETKEQHRFLQALGCHQLQGFLFSKPVPPEEIDAMLGLAPPQPIAAVTAA